MKTLPKVRFLDLEETLKEGDCYVTLDEKGSLTLRPVEKDAFGLPYMVPDNARYLPAPVLRLETVVKRIDQYK